MVYGSFLQFYNKMICSNTEIQYYGFMTLTIQISERGTLTLPKSLRKTLGLDHGGIVTAQPHENGLLLRPSVVLPVELYTDERVKEFDEADKQLSRHLKRKPK